MGDGYQRSWRLPSTRIAQQLLAEGGISGEFEALLSVEDAGLWKPARAAYGYAA